MEEIRVSQPTEYDAIAEAYQDSKRLPFREYVERYTLFDMLGDVRGKAVLDVACGEGSYTRLLKQAGGRGGHGCRYFRGDDSTGGKRRTTAPLGLPLSTPGRGAV